MDFELRRKHINFITHLEDLGLMDRNKIYIKYEVVEDYLERLDDEEDLYEKLEQYKNTKHENN